MDRSYPDGTAAIGKVAHTVGWNPARDDQAALLDAGKPFAAGPVAVQWSGPAVLAGSVVSGSRSGAGSSIGTALSVGSLVWMSAGSAS